jgi:hypothetical protein
MIDNFSLDSSIASHFNLVYVTAMTQKNEMKGAGDETQGKC